MLEETFLHFLCYLQYNGYKHDSFKFKLHHQQGFPSGSESKDSAFNTEDPDLLPGSGISHREENGNPPCILAWRIPWTEDPGQATVHGVTKSWT